ncbi:MAG: hypothetical protein NTV07_03555 [Candidatus Omnitrophica bacterium]|nr:hypothetical protein [Candidatus Omnitrophota bacterium]
MKNKICVWPSSELTSVFGTIGRQAAYLVCEKLRPQQTVLGCMPALFSGVQEDIGFARDLPIITLEGHHAHHADKLLKEYARDKVTIVVDVERLLKINLINVSDSSPQKLGPKGNKAVRFLAHYTAKIVDDLLRKK